MGSCEKIIRLNLLLDGELPEAESRKLREHLEVCDVCAQEWQAIQATSALWRNAPEPQLSETALTRIHRSVDAAMGRQMFEKVAYRLASLAALVVIAAGLWIIRPTTTTTMATVSTPTISLPESWETAAVKYSDDNTTTSADVGMATWVVADLSSLAGTQLR